MLCYILSDHLSAASQNNNKNLSYMSHLTKVKSTQRYMYLI
jgi:hypothetical protein